MNKEELEKIIIYLENKEFYKEDEVFSAGFHVAIKELQDLSDLIK